MIKKIWKYPVQDEVLMPKGAVIIAIQLINEVPTMWALVNPRIKKESRYFKVFGTDWDIDTDIYPLKEHLGTILASSGRLIWHVYEIQAP